MTDLTMIFWKISCGKEYLSRKDKDLLDIMSKLHHDILMTVTIHRHIHIARVILFYVYLLQQRQWVLGGLLWWRPTIRWQGHHYLHDSFHRRLEWLQQRRAGNTGPRQYVLAGLLIRVFHGWRCGKGVKITIDWLISCLISSITIMIIYDIVAVVMTVVTSFLTSWPWKKSLKWAYERGCDLMHFQNNVTKPL